MDVIAQAPERSFSSGDVTRMVEAGILREDEPIELLEGRLVVVSPQGPSHASITWALADRLRAAFGAGHGVREEKPLDLGDSLPEPDLAVVRGAAFDFLARHPGGHDVVLVVEVAVTSQALDHAKARIYARGGVPVLWLLDVPGRRLEVHSEPQTGGRYRVVQVLAEGDVVVPPGTDARFDVRALLGE